MSSQKSVQALIIDTGPLIKNTVAISTLLQQAEEIYTTPAVISEIRDEATRSRVETTLRPFLKERNPSPASYEIVAQFSKKTGDFAVLSRQDLEILALAYEIECEKLGGNWRLRSTPGQKGLGEKPPKKEEKVDDQASNQETASTLKESATSEAAIQAPTEANHTPLEKPAKQEKPVDSSLAPEEAPSATTESVEKGLSDLRVSIPTEGPTIPHQSQPQEDSDPSDNSDGEWITPSNIKKHQAKGNGTSSEKDISKQMTVATMTTDFAMQNVLLQMNLHLLSPSFQHIKSLRTYILRCHACFFTTKQMEKQFCPRCGQPTLRRVACSTNARGEFKIHLAKNFQWNTRGDRYSIPKPVSGSANGRINVGGGGKGGGKGGWGQSLILAEDQKEYVRAMGEEKRKKTRDLMDEDYLPSILTGDRNRAGGRPKAGAGRNVNSRKRF
ncbi:D-site 20S pre-rRNA nuclease [Zopfia rhizophila CBS 207.26]|uniref:20S-pre-rRNA D-site endonuclease NOB1 n=1 Tax=Zopfia rhizophila CBS 207.26 TaxID=1314779 RepID=A0A6A6EM47_9PEZI|nr:D-site 20S pre-rRNA nuclease [Zopfia rhizophila CBS 207.26]